MLTIRFGTGETLKDKIGAVELLGMLMSRGTESLDYQQLQDELTRLRAELSMNSTIGLLQISVKTKREFLPEVVALLGDVIRKPRLDANELEVMRRQVVTSLQKGLTEPQALAPNHVRHTLAPYESDDVRYVKSLEDEITMYKAVTIDQIRALHSEFLSNQKGEFAVVGDFDAAEVKALMASQLENWDSQQAYVRVDKPAHPEIPGSLRVIQIPDKANAFFYSSQLYDLRDDDPEYASLVLGNFILGGGTLSSRLGDRVRQQEGLSYGVRSSVTARAKDDRVDFVLYAITNPQNKDQLISVMVEEIERLRDDGVTADELEKAKGSYLQAARIRRTGDDALASQLLGTMFNERTMQYVADHEQQIENATMESVNAAIKKYIDPGKLVMAIAGDFVNSESQ